MKVLTDNCISKISIPSSVEYVDAVDYNPVLGLYATIDHMVGVSVWDPVSKQVVAHYENMSVPVIDVLFLPGNRVGILSEGGKKDGGCIRIFTLGKDSAELQIEDLPMSRLAGLALSPDENLLVTTDNAFSREEVFEIVMDWDNLKVLNSRSIELDIKRNLEISPPRIRLLCCSKDFEVSCAAIYSNTISSAKQCFNSEEEIYKRKEQVKITYYMLDGEEKDITATGLAHDGQNLIIANGDENIVLLESNMTEGSDAHLIASGVECSGQMRLNHKGQLMVCEADIIKLFEYDCNPRCLQDLSRCRVNETLYTGLGDKVNSLPIPSILKGYLLYQ